MKRLLAFAAMAALFTSCSDDDSNQNDNEEFFALAEGNLWVYKRYSVSAAGAESFDGRTDSVMVSGQQVVEGHNYFNLHHKVYTAPGFLTEDRDELLRVDESGHLVNETGTVIHPGADAAYMFTRPEEYGHVDYQLQDTATITVEGQDYNVYPYVGYFTPVPWENLPEGIGHSKSYQPGTGMVVERSRYVSSIAYYEDRLAYYELE